MPCTDNLPQDQNYPRRNINQSNESQSLKYHRFSVHFTFFHSWLKMIDFSADSVFDNFTQFIDMTHLILKEGVLDLISKVCIFS